MYSSLVELSYAGVGAGEGVGLTFGSLDGSGQEVRVGFLSAVVGVGGSELIGVAIRLILVWIVWMDWVGVVGRVIGSADRVVRSDELAGMDEVALDSGSVMQSVLGSVGS